MARRKSLKESLEELKKIAKNKGGTCTSSNYLGARELHSFKCGRGHTWNARPYNVKLGTWCPSCIGRAVDKKAYLEEIKKFAISKGGKCLSTKYVNPHSNLTWECELQHSWEATAANVLKKKRATWCPFCAGRHKSIDNLRKTAEERGGQCLSSTYRGARENHLWKCAEQHEWEATADSIMRGSWCGYCANNKPMSIDRVQSLADQYGFELLSSDVKNYESIVKLKCKFEHTFPAKVASLVRGRNCPYCKGYFGENACRLIFEKTFNKMFPKKRPKWLTSKEGTRLELDGYCQDLKLAFEHQGRQHYEVDGFYIKTSEDLEKRIKLDLEKVDICKQKGVNLIVIDEINTNLSKREVLKKIYDKLKSHNIKSYVEISEFEISDIKYYDKESKLNQILAVVREKGGTLDVNTFVSMKSRVTVKCNKGHQWRPVAECLLQNWCPKCAGKGLSIEEINLKVCDYGIICISKKYINEQQKLSFKCLENHSFRRSWPTIRLNPRCSICQKEKLNTNRVIGFTKQIESIVNKKGGKMLDNYEKMIKKIRFICKKRHNFSMAPVKVKNGQWCPYCSGRNNNSIERMNEHARKKGGACLSLIYKNNKTKIEWQCHKGHIWRAMPSNVIRGSWCPKC